MCLSSIICREPALISMVYKWHLKQGEEGSGKVRGDSGLASLLESPFRELRRSRLSKATANSLVPTSSNSTRKVLTLAHHGCYHKAKSQQAGPSTPCSVKTQVA